MSAELPGTDARDHTMHELDVAAAAAPVISSECGLDSVRIVLSAEASEHSSDALHQRDGTDSDHSAAIVTTTVTADADSDTTDPVQLARALVQKSMLVCFATESLAVRERVHMLRAIGRLTRGFARRLLLDPDASTDVDDTDATQCESSRPRAHSTSNTNSGSFDDPYMLPRTAVAPPRAYFAFRDGGRMFLPLIDWSAFRGYTVALWLNVERLQQQVRSPRRASRTGSQANALLDAAAPATFSLFRFTNGSGTLGVEATLTLARDASGDYALLTVSSCHPSDATANRRSASIGVVGTGDWTRVQRRIALVAGRWHLLVLAHSLHYVKRSKVTCYVDAALQFQDELVYPSGLVTASKCTIGGAGTSSPGTSGLSVKFASATMYQDELSKDLVALLFAMGPTISSFNRYATPPPLQSRDAVLGDLHGVAVASSPLAVPHRERFAAYCRLQVVFCYTAHDLAHEDYAGLGVEWLSEGTVADAAACWVAMESTAGASAEIQQRNARLGKSVRKVVHADSRAAWHRVLGIAAIPTLLHYILTGYDRVCSAADVGDTADLGAVVERIVVDVLWIIKGLLLNSVREQQETLEHYVLHVLTHVLVLHEPRLRAVWSPRSLLVCVDVVESLYAMLPAVRRRELLAANHPVQDSVWTTNPLFASGVRALLFDFRVWAATDAKTQSIYCHQLYRLACEHPRVCNDVDTVPTMLDVLRTFYATESALFQPATATSSSSSTETETEQRRTREWRQQCVTTLVDIVEVCLTNQSVLVHDVTDDEVLETTFARSSAAVGTAGSTASTSSAATPSTASGNSGIGSSSGGNGSSGSGASAFALPRRQGGVFSINLENIVWSDQTDAAEAATAGTKSTATAAPLSDDNDVRSTSSPAAPPPAPRSVHVRFALVRNLRAVVRFLLTSDDAVVSRALLLLLRRLAVSFLDMRFALVSSNIVDCLLFLMHRPAAAAVTAAAGVGSSSTKTADAAAAATARVSVAMACVPLFIYLVDWLESIEGRTVWCGLDEHLRLLLNGDGSFSIGFLELMMEFYYDPPTRLGAQQSVLMNDASKHESLLFPIASSKAATSSIHASGIVVSDDALASGSATGTSADMSSSGINGLAEWIQRARQFSGKRLSLSWEKRLAVVKLTALRNLVLATPSPVLSATISTTTTDCDATDLNGSATASAASVAEMFDEGVSGILALPLRGVLPFLPVLLGRGSASFREKVLMDLNVTLKTDEAVQQQLLLMKRAWADALLELSIACACHAAVTTHTDAAAAVDVETADNDDDNTTVSPRLRTVDDVDCGRAYSFDANRTGEDLVLDTIVSLLCVAMHNARGWRSVNDLILALKAIRIKYDREQPPQKATSSAEHLAPLVLSPPERAAQSELCYASLDWLARVVGIVLQRMARSRTMLSRTLAENVQQLLFLVHETLLARPLRQAATAAGTLVSPSLASASQSSPPPSSALAGWIWSDAQLFLLNAVLDVCARLVESTHKLHRVGLVPGLQILERALPFITGRAMLARVIDVLVASFQHEMGLVAALKVYDAVPPRDVFLTALVCLRRALVLQDRDDLLDLLRVLVLRITTSGCFSDELHAAGVTVQALSVMTEANAAIVALDALALAINDTEMHEREHEAERALHFPAANDLRQLDTTQQQRRFSPSMAPADATVESRRSDLALDESDQVLWAALEVEENRMLELLRDATTRDRMVVQRRVDVRAARRRAWTDKLWRKHEYAFRSQHQHNALGGGAASDALQALQHAQVYRIGLYETPHPGRMRRMLDVDLNAQLVGARIESSASRVANNMTTAVATIDDNDNEPSEPRTLDSDAGAAAAAGADAASTTRRRQFSLPLEIVHSSLDYEVAHQSPLNSPASRVNGSLLERVGRVVAEQRGGEIQDITTDSLAAVDPLEAKGLDDTELLVPASDASGAAAEATEAAIAPPDTNATEPLDSKRASLQLAYDSNVSAYAGEDEDKTPAPSVEGSPVSLSALRPLVTQLPQLDVEHQYECGLDPSEGVAVTADDQLVARAVCRRVIPEGIVSGTLFLSNEHLAFEPDAPSSLAPPSSAWNSTTGAATPDTGSTAANGTSTTTVESSNASSDEAAPGLHRCWRWRYDNIVAVYLRRYRLRDSAIELFLRNGSNHFLDFPLAARHQRNELVRLLYSFLPRSVPKQWPGRGISSLGATTKAWQQRQLSNFEYLMALNTFAGRSFNDLTQYPVFPWVLSNYDSATLDLSDPQNFRDLSKPVGALNPARLDEFWERYNSFDDPVIPKFLYGSHYSTCAGVVLFFLFRLQPFAELQRRMQGGAFDLPDRLFHSVRETWAMCNSQMSEVKELTPEFFCDASFLRNVNGFALGRRHDQQRVHDVELPPWAATPEDFVRLHRAALESDFVSQHLHEWVDLIFGAKQRGKAALKAHNVFYYLTYYGVVDLDRVDDPFLRESMELQIAHFGQCPMQLFGAPHPKRNATAFARRVPALASVAAGSTSASGISVGSAAGGNSSDGASVGTATGATSPVAAPASARTPGSTNMSTSTAATASVVRPLSLSFQDCTAVAQERRRHWSASVDIKPLVQCAIRLIKVLPDRIVTVNELGVIDTYNWKLVPKPQLPPTSQSSQSLQRSHSAGASLDSAREAVAVAVATTPVSTEPLAGDAAVGAPYPGSPTLQSDSQYTPFGTPYETLSPAVTTAAPTPTPTPALATDDALKHDAPQCPWLIDVSRDDAPFDFIPRMPFHDAHASDNSSSASNSNASFPVATSSNGRVLLSGGGRSGALHLRLLDLDSGQIVGKASVTGHDGAVTCISVDRLSYSAGASAADEEELVVSGARDCTLALWRLSRVKQDLLFRLPRISSSPILTLRGHCAPVVDCCVSTLLGLVVSCSDRAGVVHYLHSEGQVAFVFEPPTMSPTVLATSAESARTAVFTHVRLSMKGAILAVSRSTAKPFASSMPSAPLDDAKPAAVQCVCQVFTLSGVLLHAHRFAAGDDIRDVRLSAEGDLVFFTLLPSTIRICRLDDFAVVQEYASPTHIDAPTTATCFGPSEAVVVLASGHADGTLVLQLLPDADGSISFLASVRKMLGVSSKLKIVKGTVQQAQSLAMTTLGNAKAVTSTARDIAGEALGEAKSIVKGFFTYLQRQSQG